MVVSIHAFASDNWFCMISHAHSPRQTTPKDHNAYTPSVTDENVLHNCAPPLHVQIAFTVHYVA